MINMFFNPELLRMARSQLRIRKLLSVAIICIALSISIAYLFSQREAVRDVSNQWAMTLLQFVLAAQALVLGAGGSIACLNCIFKEKEQNSFDYQRLTRLSSVELALGKLFGAPILMYFVCLCLMPLSIFAALAAHCLGNQTAAAAGNIQTHRQADRLTVHLVGEIDYHAFPA